MTDTGGKTTRQTEPPAELSPVPVAPASAPLEPLGNPPAAGAIRQTALPPRKRGRIIVVASGKGGVGKTHIAANMAITLAVAGQRVLLVDADLGLANVDLVLGERPRGDLAHVLAGRQTLDEIMQTGPAGLRWIPGASHPSVTGRTDDRRREELLAGLTTLETQHDFIILDAPAGIGRGVLALAQQADQLVLVTTPEPTALMDAYTLLKALAVPVGPASHKTAAARQAPQTRPPLGEVRLVVNMITHRVDAERVHRRIDLAARRFLGVPVSLLGYVYCDGHVGQAVRRQQPLVLAYPHSQAAWCIKRLAGALLDTVQEPAAGRFAFFRRLANFLMAG
jgi:flagellar biosynthesis protein FlhG